MADIARLNAFEKAKPSPQAKANWARDTCRDWKIDQRKRASEKHLKRAKHCANIELVKSFYNTIGTAFENTFEQILTTLGIAHEKLDDKTKTGAPDYLLKLQDSPPIIFVINDTNSNSAGAGYAREYIGRGHGPLLQFPTAFFMFNCPLFHL